MSRPVVLNPAIVPIEYDLTITPNLLPPYKYEGEVDIKLEIKSSDIQEISLHAKEIYITSATYVPDNGNPINVQRYLYDSHEVTVEMFFFEKGADKAQHALPSGNGTLKISFIGEHNNQMAGFYRSSYTDAKGQKKNYGINSI